MLPSGFMGASPVELSVGGKTYRVVASADAPELERLAAVVDGKLRDVSGPGRPIAPQAMLLAAMTLAHELEEERARRRRAEERARELLTNVLARIDTALEEADAVLRPTPADAEPAEAESSGPPPLDG